MGQRGAPVSTTVAFILVFLFLGHLRGTASAQQQVAADNTLLDVHGVSRSKER